MKDTLLESSTKKRTNSQEQRLQRSLLGSRFSSPDRDLEGTSEGGSFGSLLPNWQSSMPSSAVVQTKLTVNEPDDQYEQEAERVADTVMRMPLPMVAPPALGPPPLANPLHTLRGRASEGNNSSVDERRMPPGSGPSLMRVPTYPSMDISSMMHIPPVQALLIARAQAERAEAYEASRLVSPTLESRIQGMNGGGSPLPTTEQNFFESRMGADFSGVRVHTGTNAVQTSRDINARAFTTGNNIAFNEGEYQPGTTAGRHLLAHELTHVVQQGATSALQPTAEEQIEVSQSTETASIKKSKLEADPAAKEEEAPTELQAHKLTHTQGVNTSQMLRPPSTLGHLGRVQAKLTVNDPNDAYEQEAEQVADSVMRMPSNLSRIGRQASTVQMSSETPLPALQLDRLMTSEKSLSNGQMQRTTRIPFTQVIARSEADHAETEKGPSKQEEPLSIGEITSPEEIDSVAEDAISSNFPYISTVKRGGGTPNGFGVTRSGASLKNISITPTPGTYVVTGQFEYTIQWQVRSGTGPGGQVDITDENDPDVKACNYQLVAKDLTPDMSDLNGRPPRTEFWAEDLTKRHELYHANDRQTYGQNGATKAQTWLNAQTANSVPDVQALLQPAFNEAAREINTLMATAPGKEERAYGDGAPLYQARADAIKTKGDGDGYGRISIAVTAHSAVGDNWLAGADDVYVKLSFNGKTYQTNQQEMNDGDSKTFWLSARDLFSDLTNCAGDVTIEVWDADSGLTGGDDLLMTMTWSLPGDANDNNGNYEITAKIAP